MNRSLFKSRPFPSFAVVALGGVALAIASMGGCGDSGVDGSDGPDPVECEGGVVVDGKCEGKCTPDKCLEGNVCVGNRCALQCDAHTDCNVPAVGGVLQGCEPTKADSETGLNDGQSVSVCAALNLAPKMLRGCPIGNECDDPDDPNDWACPDGSPCTEGTGGETCGAEQCRPLICRTAGEGDADAYCVATDCTEDAHCGPGMYCSLGRWPNIICGSDPEKGTEEPCIDPADFAKDGATYQEGPVSLLRNVCKKREPCAPCSSTADCSLRGDMDCVAFNDQRVCAKTCGSDDDCQNDSYCTGGFCIPRTDTCKPPTEDNFCYSCLDDLDCGNAGNSVACVETAVGQRACLDTSFSTACESDSDCPESPSGQRGECLDEGEQVAPGTDIYHRCYLPFWPAAGSFECWRD